MSYTLKCYIDATHELTIVSAQLLTVKGSSFVALLGALEGLLAQGIDDFDYKESATTSGTFKYQFVHSDGREWKQEIIYNGSEDPTMTFNVNDPWKVSEFAPHRDVRDAVVALTSGVGATKISVTAVQQ